MSRHKPLGEQAMCTTLGVSVIISTYNAREVIANCLESIYQNPPREPYEVILVDDASTDRTSEMVRARFPDVRLLRNERNLHYTRSNNRALDLARGKYVYLLNNDTIMLAGAIDQMASFLESHPEAGAVGSKLLNEDGTIQWSVKSLPDLGSALFGGRGLLTWLFPNNRFTRRRFLHHEYDLSKPFVAGYLSGASKMMPRKVIEEIGYLDNRLFYHVDADYCKRIADGGYYNYYLPSAAVIHLNHKGGTMINARLRLRSLLSFHRDCYTYYCKHVHKWTWNPMRLALVGALAARFVTVLWIQLCGEAADVIRARMRQQHRGAD